MIRAPNDHLAGNDDGWEWGEAHRVCLRLAYRYASNPSEAEDIAQDALLRAWRRRSTLRDAERRNPWLAAIVRNEAFRQHARVRPDPTSAIEGEGVEDERVVATVELADLRSALKRLNEERRMRGKLDQVSRTNRQAKAQLRGDGKADLKWSGGRAGSK